MEPLQSLKVSQAPEYRSRRAVSEPKTMAASTSLENVADGPERCSIPLPRTGSSDASSPTSSAGNSPSPLMPISPEKECQMAIRWLKHTGFPQYAQQYRNNGFPITIDSAKLAEENGWLKTYPDALQTLQDRLEILNQCAVAKIGYISEDDDSDEETLRSDRRSCSPERSLLGSTKHYRSPSPHPLRGPCRLPSVVDEEDGCDDGGEEKGSDSRRKLCPNPRVKLERSGRVRSRPKASYCRQISLVTSEDEGSDFSRAASRRRVPLPVVEPSTSLGSSVNVDLYTGMHISTDQMTRVGTELVKDNAVGVVQHKNTLVVEEEEEELVSSTSMNRRQRWHSFSSRHPTSTTQENGRLGPATPRAPNDLLAAQTVRRMQILRHMSLLKLTSQLECHISPNLPKSKRQKVINNLDYTRKKTHDYDRTATLFGVPLEVLTRRNGQPLPRHIMFALDYVLCRGIETQGLFRVAGSSKRIKEFKKKASSSDDPIDFSEIPMADIACLVKEYFRDIPGRLFTTRMSDAFILISAFMPDELHLQALQHVMLLLPDENRETLFCLLSFLRNIAEHHEKTKMDVHNLAVVFAPTLFYLSSTNEVLNGHSSPPSSRRLKKKKADYDENANAISILELMITNVDQLQRVPMDTLMISLHTSTNPLDFTEAAHLSELGRDQDGSGDYISYIEFCIQGMLKEHNSGYKNGWIQVSTSHPCEISKKKVRDGHQLQLWRGVIELAASPSNIQRRILRERDLWDSQLVSEQVIEVLDDQTDVYQYVCSSVPSQPNRESVVLRSWWNREDINIIMSTSIQHPKASSHGGVVITELATRYVIEPLTASSSRLTLIVRHDMCGRSLNFYKNYGPWSVAQICMIRDSFAPDFVVPASPRSRPNTSATTSAT